MCSSVIKCLPTMTEAGSPAPQKNKMTTKTVINIHAEVFHVLLQSTLKCIQKNKIKWFNALRNEQTCEKAGMVKC